MNDNSTKLNEQSRRSARCETPRSESNAVLVDLPPLQCEENTNDMFSFSYEDSENGENDPDLVDLSKLSYAGHSFDREQRLLYMSWSTSVNMSEYRCDQVQVQCVPNVIDDEVNARNQPKEVYSKRLGPECSNLTNNTLINVVRDC